MISERCQSKMGQEEVEEMAFSQDADTINARLRRVAEFGRLLQTENDLAIDFFFDARPALMKIRPEGTFMEEEELFDLKRSLETIETLVRTLNKSDNGEDGDALRNNIVAGADRNNIMAQADRNYIAEETGQNGFSADSDGSSDEGYQATTEGMPDLDGMQDTDDSDGRQEAAVGQRRRRVNYLYPALHELAEDVITFPLIIKGIDRILDKYGRMKDTASPELERIRQELARLEGSISRTLTSILRTAQHEGTVEKDVTPTMRDGRLVIPVAPAMKRKIKGIVHDESASGKTVFIEPQEVVEANNKIRELENEERREVVKILREMTKEIRPYVSEITESYIFLGEVDFIWAKAKLTDLIGGTFPKVKNEPFIDWIQARHPLLQLAFAKRNGSVSDTYHSAAAERVAQYSSLARATQTSPQARATQTSPLAQGSSQTQASSYGQYSSYGQASSQAQNSSQTQGSSYEPASLQAQSMQSSAQTSSQAQNPSPDTDFSDDEAMAVDNSPKKVVPLDITLTPEKRLLIISGPNAGGKSVCLKTVGLLQYMLQCGLPIPVGDRSTAGVFGSIMIDIGDEQSIENDLSTYSSHLLNMKMMMRHSSAKTLLLIDEFGTGTEPGIGGAIAESVLKQFWKKKAWGVITTHYQNLKLFAQDHEGVANGAMLYDRHEMRPLFQLAIGQPGSSFAIEIARKIGIPEEVIRDASDIVGSDYIQSDKYLQDIVRDKRYWEGKRQTVHQQEKRLDDTIEKYEHDVEALRKERKEILRKAKEEAQALLDEANRRIENTIREIKEAQAEKEATRRIRQEFEDFRDETATVDQKEIDEKIARKMRQIQARRERQQKRKGEKGQWKMENGQWTKTEPKAKAPATGETPDGSADTAAAAAAPQPVVLSPGDTVKLKGTSTVGKIESINGKEALVAFGDIHTRTKLSQLEPAQKVKTLQSDAQAAKASRVTRVTIDTHREHFHQEIDIRGMRADEALDKVMHFIDDAILVGVHNVRILHGKGNGILRQLVRQYLSSVPNVISYRDEHVQFGGAGITVVEL